MQQDARTLILNSWQTCFHKSKCDLSSQWRYGYLISANSCGLSDCCDFDTRTKVTFTSICPLALEECHPFGATTTFQVVTYHAQSCAITGKRNTPTPSCSYFKARLKSLKLGSWTDTTDGAGFCKSHIFISFDSSRISHLVHLYLQWVWETAS